MTIREEIKLAILRTLRRLEGDVLKEGHLFELVRLHPIAGEATLGDFGIAVSELQADGYILGTTQPLLKQRQWGLTSKGEHAAAQLG
jgi:hypothetical protein